MPGISDSRETRFCSASQNFISANTQDTSSLFHDVLTTLSSQALNDIESPHYLLTLLPLLAPQVRLASTDGQHWPNKVCALNKACHVRSLACQRTLRAFGMRCHGRLRRHPMAGVLLEACPAAAQLQKGKREASLMWVYKCCFSSHITISQCKCCAAERQFSLHFRSSVAITNQPGILHLRRSVALAQLEIQFSWWRVHFREEVRAG